MKQYDTYKDSSIPSIGTIPNSWRVVPIKYVLEQSANGIKIGPFGSTLTGKVSPANQIKVYGQWNVIGKDFSAGKNYVSEDTYQELESYWIHPNDILISMMGTVGKCAIIPKGVAKGIMDSHIVKVRLDETIILPQFFYYVYDKDGSNVVISQIQRDRRGSIMDGLNSTLIKSFIIPLPPLSEQQDIVSFLDEKVNMIDATIAEKEQMLKDLKNYRSAIISEAVTKGLDKNVEMKDSGVECIGMIPKHWNINKLKFFADISTGTTPSTDNEEYWKEPTENWYTPSDFCEENVHLETSSRKVSTTAFQESACRVFKKDVVLVVGIGATLGKIGISSVECSANQQINAIEFYDNVYPLFGAYYLSSLKEVMKSLASAATLAIMNQSVTGSIPFVCPTLDEQKEIADYLEKKTKSIGSLLNQIEVQIDELKSYKSALITEAVTGKIDLRDWKPKEENV